MVNPTFTTIEQYTVEYFGKDAHAAGAPDQGINALDAQIQLFVNASPIDSKWYKATECTV